jgi:hypothetical protein
MMSKINTVDFEIQGVTYTSLKADYGCRGCVFEKDLEKCVNESPDCYGGNSYNPEIIFIKKV